MAAADSEGINVDHLLPAQKSLQRFAGRARQFPDPSPCTKKSHRPEYVIPEQCKFTYCNRIFLIYDEPGDKNRIIIFATDRNVKYLKNCKYVLCDGTFLAQCSTLHN